MAKVNLLPRSECWEWSPWIFKQKTIESPHQQDIDLHKLTSLDLLFHLKMKNKKSYQIILVNSHKSLSVRIELQMIKIPQHIQGHITLWTVTLDVGYVQNVFLNLFTQKCTQPKYQGSCWRQTREKWCSWNGLTCPHLKFREKSFFFVFNSKNQHFTNLPTSQGLARAPNIKRN